MGTIDRAMNKIRNAGADSKLGVRRYSVPQTAGAQKNSESVIPNSDDVEVDVHIDFDHLNEKGLLTPDNGRSIIAEQMREIKRPLLRNILSANSEQNRRSNLIMVTSALPGEGKSYSSINLAISIAMELDRTALLIDADVAKPSLMDYLNLSSRPGLVDCLTDENIQLSNVIFHTNIPKLSIMSAGKQHHYATELLASNNMERLVVELSDRYADRVIIFDSPPLLATSEARVLTSLMGQILIVVEANKTSATHLNDAISLIDPHAYKGLLLNKSYRASGSDYYSGYGYYGSGADRPNKK